MGDWPQAFQRASMGGLSPNDLDSVGGHLLVTGQHLGNAAVAWPAANLAIYLPVVVHTPVTVVKMGLQPVTPSGNCDVGIYGLDGNRRLSSGSTASSAPSGTQEFDVTDTTLSPGCYYLAVAFDNTTAVLAGSATAVSLPDAQSCGVLSQSSAFPLPATATFATATSGFIPWVVAALRTTVF